MWLSLSVDVILFRQTRMMAMKKTITPREAHSSGVNGRNSVSYEAILKLKILTVLV